MNPEIYKDISLMAEYNFSIGGAQRMLSAVSKKIRKPIYVLNDSQGPIQPIWDVDPIPGVPDAPIIISLVVDKYSFRTFSGKKQIKFCHSGESLENFLGNEQAKITKWLTHRGRVYNFWKERGFNIDLIPRGYIPYDKERLEITPIKRDQGVFISRVCPSKGPELAIQTFDNLAIPLYIAGSNELRDYISSLKKSIKGSNIAFIPPDEGSGMSLKLRDDLLRESKVLVHCSLGGMHDYLEYSILDGMIFNCVPLCITPEVEQFSVVEEKCFGRVVRNPTEAVEALEDILSNYGHYSLKVRDFMGEFLKDQEALWERWKVKIEEACLKLT